MKAAGVKARITAQKQLSLVVAWLFPFLHTAILEPLPDRTAAAAAAAATAAALDVAATTAAYVAFKG